jgi:hypothetical protein
MRSMLPVPMVVSPPRRRRTVAVGRCRFVLLRLHPPSNDRVFDNNEDGAKDDDDDEDAAMIDTIVKQCSRNNISCLGWLRMISLGGRPQQVFRSKVDKGNESLDKVAETSTYS